MSQLRCANGGRWTATGCGPCRKCQAELEKDCRAFDRAVFFADLNRLGYTESEWTWSGRAREAWRDAR